MAQFKCSNNLEKLLEPTIIQKIVTLSKQYDAINLASGFPDWETPEFVSRGLQEAIRKQENQYCLPGGHPDFREQVATIYSKKLGFPIDPNKNISIGQGASGCIYDIYTAFLDQGDEVIIFDPHYEFLSKEALLLGAVVRHSSLIEPKDHENEQFTINFQEFEKLFNNKTKILLLNNPQNPTGKIFTFEELTKISENFIKTPLSNRNS
ncbi:hypothetical protein IMG5_066080 [Ichthyophthirius multifiliis]|uniref:Aminotransferase class I/classII large domain-containing protein n=1 Tax=Ichthyophthirius multifiliis TaxID=5932 RepID=G0QPB5_ICHMU|nr:hypothetical protein IMG5_066080 [Ichthyophthirius multifiliis]EGR32952.1 hypothetical protein IMG5_066080 [Ichthyophthirius multifiliis]|eukprot:XP_004036938.1 hypothetical protein IMG5_066080 [Ichthyophthirius multifiliis]